MVESFKDLTKVKMFARVCLNFFFIKGSFFLVLSFNIYLIGDYVPFLFSLLSVEFLIGLENDLLFLGISCLFFYLIFFS
jgi:hypothetical protein